MQDCIFCKIIDGSLPCYKIYEDSNYLAFMDIFPRVKGHALVIPKKHHRWVYDVKEFGTYWEVARKVAQILQNYLSSEYVSFVTVGKEVPHAHIHVLPQKEGTIQGITFGPVLPITKEEIAKMANEVMRGSA